MDKFELLKKTFKLEHVERIPYSLWKHFPEHDKAPETLAKVHVEFQEKYDSDILKISIHGRSFIVDFGAELGGYDPISGSRICTRPPVDNIQDWKNLDSIDINDGELGKQIKAIELLDKKLGGKVPKMITVFSPFMVSSQIDPKIIQHYNEDPTLIKERVEMITSVMTQFTRASVEAGADGIFLATQHFNQRLEEKERMELEFNTMLSLINKGLGKDTFLILHLHGEEPDFILANKLPRVSAINWHDQQTIPNLKEARKMFNGALLGGLDSESWKKTLDLKKEKEKIISSYDEFKAQGLILAPGCVIPQYVSDETLRTIVTLISDLKT